MPATGQDPIARRVIAAVQERMKALDMTQPQLASRAGISAARIQRLLSHGSSTSLELPESVRLCEVVGIGAEELAMLLWPAHRRDDANARIDQLQTENRHLRAELQSDTARLIPTPTRSLLQFLLASADWAFSYRPYLSGPGPLVQLHVSNRFAVVSTREPLRGSEHRVLRSAFLADIGSLPRGVYFAGSPSPTARRDLYPFDPDGGHPFQEGPRGLMLLSAVYHADRPLSADPVTLRGAPGRGVVVLAMRELAERQKLAVTLARALGWQCNSTQRTGRAFVRQLPDPREDAHRANLYANNALAEVVTRSVPNLVSSHVGTPVVGADGRIEIGHALLTADPDGEGPFVVLLSETDRLIRQALSRPVNQEGGKSAFTFEQLTTWRDELRDRVEHLALRGQGMVIETDLPYPEAYEAGGEPDADAIWRRTSVQARQALQQILALGGSSRSNLSVRDPEALRILSFNSPTTWY